MKCFKYCFTTLVICCTFSVNIVSYAATCDDVRQLYGGTALDTEDYHDYVGYVDTLGDLANKRENSIDLINAQERKDKLYEKYDLLVNEREMALTELIIGMKNYDDALDLIGLTKNIMELDVTLKTYNLDQNDFNLENSVETFNKLNTEIGNNRNYLYDSYDIGELGKCWPLEVSNNFILKGYKSIGSENGVYISANKSDYVYAMYGGIVTKIEYSDTYGNWLEIQSGKGLSISYSFLEKPLVKLGEEVKQGDIIAKINNDRLYIESILDTKYINPMLLLGEMGIIENNRWIYSNIGISDKNTLLDFSSYNFTPIRKIWDTTPQYNKGGTDKVSIEDLNQ